MSSSVRDVLPATGRRKAKSLSRNFRLLRDNHGTFDGIFEFADIAGPLITIEQCHGRRRDAGDALVHRSRELAHEMLDEDGDVALAIAQGRQLNLKHVEAIEKVGPEPPFFDELLQMLVCRGDAAEVHVNGM